MMYTSDEEARKLRASVSTCNSVMMIQKDELIRLLNTRDDLMALARDVASRSAEMNAMADSITMSVNP